MATIVFQELLFIQEKDRVRCLFQDYAYFYLDNKQLDSIARFKVIENGIEFDETEKKARNKLNRLIESGFHNLRSIIANRKTVYIHKNSGIPLLGNQYFGFVDRNTNLIEIRPCTGCNLCCIYCSVDEGVCGKKTTDYFVEKDYIVSEFKTLLEEKKSNNIEVHINPQGEPLLYKPLPELICDLKSIPAVKKISMDTNGVLLSEKLIDVLVKSGLTQLNISLNAIDSKIAGKLADKPYNTEKVLNAAIYASKKIDVILAPIWLSGINDDEIDKILEKCIKYNLKPGIQNFLQYKHGRNPAKGKTMDKFYEKLKKWEEKHKISLHMDKNQFGITSEPISNPFKKNENVAVDIVCEGRFKNEFLGVARNRTISVISQKKTKGRISVFVTRTKHNIIVGKKK